MSHWPELCHMAIPTIGVWGNKHLALPVGFQKLVSPQTFIFQKRLIDSTS